MRPDERDLDEEIRGHLAISVKERIERGEDPKTARLAALREFGDVPAIREQTDDLLTVETGSLYPALHRLEKRGWLKSEWDVSEANQRAKYYRLTAAGKAQLSREQDRKSTRLNSSHVVTSRMPSSA